MNSEKILNEIKDLNLKSMRTTIIGLCICFAILLTIWIYFFNILGKQVKLIESNLGKQYIFGKDTTIITDYSILDECYILSNGKKINFKLVK